MKQEAFASSMSHGGGKRRGGGFVKASRLFDRDFVEARIAMMINDQPASDEVFASQLTERRAARQRLAAAVFNRRGRAYTLAKVGKYRRPVATGIVDIYWASLQLLRSHALKLQHDPQSRRDFGHVLLSFRRTLQ